MGGSGSGNHRGARYTVESALYLPIGLMIRQCPIREGTWFRSVSWSRGDNESGSCCYILTRDHEKPVSIVVKCAKEGEPFEQSLKLAYHLMPKGGLKTYALCPYCGNRRLLLYFTSSKWLSCRLCANYTYDSSQSSRKSDGLLGTIKMLFAAEDRVERKIASQENARLRCVEWRRRSKRESRY